MILYRKVLIMGDNINYEEKINELVEKFREKGIEASSKLIDPSAGEQEYYVEISFKTTRKCPALHSNKELAMKEAYEKALKEFNSLSD